MSHWSGLNCSHECVICRLGSLVEEVEEVLQGRGEAAVSWEEGYSAPLYARVHMRLGMWQWTINNSEVSMLCDELKNQLVYARVHMRLGMWQWTLTSSEVGLLR